MKLKLWVKVVLATLVMIMAVTMLNNNQDKQMQKCIEAGHSQAYCEIHLN